MSTCTLTLPFSCQKMDYLNLYITIVRLFMPQHRFTLQMASELGMTPLKWRHRGGRHFCLGLARFCKFTEISERPSY